MNKKNEIKKLTKSLLRNSAKDMMGKVDKALNSGALDIEAWDINNNPWILPKIIAIAILQDEATQYDCRGTSFENKIKKEVANLKLFL